MKKLVYTLLFFAIAGSSYSQWLPDVRLTNAPSYSQSSSVSASGTAVHVVWMDWRDGNAEIYYKRSTDGGLNWGTDIRLTYNSAWSGEAVILVSGSTVHVVWSDDRDGNIEIYYKCSTDGGLSWGTDIRLTNNSASSRDAVILVSGSTVHVVWDDERDGN